MFEPHPFAELFPMRPGKPLTELAESMREHGQKDEIVLYEGKVLDGRRRQMAAAKAGIEPRYRQFGDRPGDGTDALAFSFAVNYHRRDDLTVAEKVLAAAKYATARKGFRGAAAGSAAGPGEAAPVSRKEAADRFGVHEKAVSRAKTVMAKGTLSLQEAVRTEQVGLADAAAIAREPAAVQDQAMAAVQSGDAPTLKAAVQKAKGPRPEDPAKIGRQLTRLLERLARVEVEEPETRDVACERLRQAIDAIGKLSPLSQPPETRKEPAHARTEQ